jgi:hypothetical protein
MDCRLTKSALVSYTLGATSLEDGERERIEEHLVACTECLRGYLRLKHHLGRSEGGGERPSEGTRRRIRADVADLVRPGSVERVRQWLRRPIPLYQGLAVAAVAAGVAIALPQAMASIDAARRAPETMARVDMSRPVPQLRTVY